MMSWSHDYKTLKNVEHSKLLRLLSPVVLVMPAKTALCTCQRFCQAPPEGKAIPIRTWYNHASQRNLEEQMTQQQCDNQKSRIRVRRAKRTRLQFEVQNFDICEITSIAVDPKTFRKSITSILMTTYHSQTTTSLMTQQDQLPFKLTGTQWICEQILHLLVYSQLKSSFQGWR